MTPSAWNQRWRVLAPSTSRVVEVPTRRVDRRLLAAELRRLDPGAVVVLRDGRRFSRRRCRSLARSADLRVRRELIALPSLERSAYLVEDDRASVRFAWRSLLTTPPGVVRGHAALSGAVGLGRHLPWSFLGRVAPGRVVVADRS